MAKRLTDRERYVRSMTEDDLLVAVTEAATNLGWKWHHVRRSDKALTMGDPGFPDLCMVRGVRLLFVELKTETGKYQPGQEDWLAAIAKLNDVTGNHVDALVVRPHNLDALLIALAAG